jgi:hypothetical protein
VCSLLAAVAPKIERFPISLIGPRQTAILAPEQRIDESQPRTWLELVSAKVQASAGCLPGHFDALQGKTGGEGPWGTFDFASGPEEPLFMSDYWYNGTYSVEGVCQGDGSASVNDLRVLAVPFRSDEIEVAEQFGTTENFSAGGFQTILTLNAAAGTKIVLLTLEFQAAMPEPATFRLQSGLGAAKSIGFPRIARSEWRTIAFLAEVTGTNIELQLQGGVFGNPVLVRQIRMYAIASSRFSVAEVTHVANPGALRDETVMLAKPGRYLSIQMLSVQGTAYQASLVSPAGSASLSRSLTDRRESLTMVLPELIDVNQVSGASVNFQTFMVAPNIQEVNSEVSRLLLGPFEQPTQAGDGGLIADSGMRTDAGVMFDSGTSAGDAGPSVDAGTESPDAAAPDSGLATTADAHDEPSTDGGQNPKGGEPQEGAAEETGELSSQRRSPLLREYSVQCGCNQGQAPFLASLFVLIARIRARRRRANVVRR